MSGLIEKGRGVYKTVEGLFQTPQQQPKYVTPFESKTRFTMIGPVGSGKTTIAALMLITAETRSQDEPGFYCNVLEHGSQIRQAAWNLRAGRFPPKTVPTQQYAYESGLEILRKKFIGDKKIHVPLIDVAGEDQQLMLVKYEGPKAVRNPINYVTAKTLLNYMKSSKGHILTLCAPRVPIPGLDLDKQLETEPEGISNFPDVNISRMLQEVINYKKGKNIEGIAVVITKWDILQPYLIEKQGIDLYTPGGVEQFMNVYFPGTSMQLKRLKDQGIVRFFPSHVSLQKDENGNVEYWGPNEPKVEVVTKELDEDGKEKPCLKPKYSEGPYMEMFDFLESYAS
jgi:hypothetical protein